MTTIKGVYLQPSEAKCEIKTIEYDESPYYQIRELIGARVLESPTYRFGTSRNAPILDVICDEEGMYAFESGNADVSAIDSEQRICAYGNLFICSHDEEGNWVSLSDEELNAVVDCVRNFRRRDGARVMMVLVEYPYWKEHNALMEQAEKEGWGIINC